MYVRMAAVLNPVTYVNESEIECNRNIQTAGAKTSSWVSGEQPTSRDQTCLRVICQKACNRFIGITKTTVNRSICDVRVIKHALWSDIIGIFMSTIKHFLTLLQSCYFRSGLSTCCHAVSACWRADSSEFPMACPETQSSIVSVPHVIWEISWLSCSCISEGHR